METGAETGIGGGGGGGGGIQQPRKQHYSLQYVNVEAAIVFMKCQCYL